MKTISIKIISSILTVFTLTITLLSCGSAPDTFGESLSSDFSNELLNNGQNGEEDEIQIIDVSNFPNGSFPIFNGKEYVAKVVQSDNANAAERQVASSLRNVLKSKIGSAVAESTDYLKSGETYDANSYEILVGETSRDESKSIYDSTAYNNYGIKTVGKKIVIYFTTAAEGEELVKSFTKAMKSNGKGLFWVESSLSISNVASVQISAVPKYSHGTVKTVDCADNTSMMVATSTNLDNFNKYCTTLTSNGYEEYSKRENVDGNYFRTYTKGATAVTAYFSKGRSQARIIIGPIKDIPTKEKDTTAETFKPSVTMIGPSESIGNSLALIYQLANGKFLIIDGGLYLADRIYKELKELQPNAKKFIIAGWFISHPHNDHQDSIEFFLKEHMNDVEIENIFFNYANASYYDSLSASWAQSEGAKEGHSVNRLHDLLAKYVSRGTNIIKPHTGQIYEFGSASVEIIATVEDYLPTKLDEVNTSSLVIRVKVAGQTTMVLTDSFKSMLKDIILKMYSSHLKSDMVTLAHHGVQSTTPEAYETIGAKVLFWPSNTTSAHEYYHNKASGQTQEAYTTVRKAVSVATDVFLAKGTDTKLNLPYTPVGNKQSFINSIK